VAADLDVIREAFCQKTYLFTTSARPKMRKLGLSAAHIEEAICQDSPEIIEDYEFDGRGPACLVLGWADLAQPLLLAQPLHIVVGYGFLPQAAIEVVTVYEPDERKWHNHRVRRE
jgi:hypothetical protein